MNLEKIAAHLRVRTPFEAIDFGFLIAQRFARPLWTAWLAILGPIFFIILTIAYFTDSFWIPLLTLWWLKPIYARIPVIVLSRAFFGAVPGHAQTLRDFPKAARKPSTIWQLTIGRFSSFRGFTMFINDLEGGTSAQRRQRTKILRNYNLDMAIYTLFFGVMACEWLFFLASLFFISLIQPPNVDFSIAENIFALLDGEYPQPAFETFLLVCYALAISLTEPLFAAANFGLYINRRVELEGWDIELTFRKIATRIQTKYQPNFPINTAIILIAAFLTTLFSLAPLPASAHESALPPETTEITHTEPEAKTLIQEILTAPEFGQPEIKQVWQFRHFPDVVYDGQDEPTHHFPFGQFFSVLAWAIAIALALLLAFLLFRRLSIPSRSKNTPLHNHWQQNLVLHDDTPKITQDLPADIIAHARAARAQGDETRALTLLYAGMLRSLHRDFHLEPAPGLTAYETTRFVRKHNGPHDVVAQIANAWTARVFAHKPLDDHAFETILQRWQATFSLHPTNQGSTP